MVSNAKEVKVKVATEEELSGVEALELRIDRLNKQRIQLHIDTQTEELNKTSARIEEIKRTIAGLEAVPAHLGIDIDEQEINKLKGELAQLEQQSLDLQLSIETGELQKAKMEAEDLDGTTIDVDVNNIKAMEAVDQIGQGFDRLKQGATEVGEQFGVLLDKAGEAEQNKAFLEIGFDKAGSKQAEKDAIDAQKRIQDIVAKAPGDDTAMNSILSSAVAKDVKLMDKDMQGFANSVSDYFAGAEVNGKHAAEAIQDVRSYITSGNVAELETTGIFDQSQLDQLKDIDDVGERVAKFQEMVNQSSYAGLGTADTLNNKWAEFGGMMDKSRTQLGGFFTDATKGTLDWILKLNDATGGLAGMGLALVQMASPLTDVVMGLGQMATGVKSLKEIGDFTGITDKLSNVKTKVLELAGSIKSSLLGAFSSLKTTMSSTIIPALKNVATAFLNTGRAALTAGLNALRSAGMWLIQKAQMVVSTIATWAQTAAQWALNSSILANPITWLVIAIVALIAVLGYLYFNNEQVRAAIDGLGQSFILVGQIIYTSIVNAINWVIGALQNLWNYIVTLGGLLPANVSITGNQIIDTILRVLAFLATLPLQIGMIFINIIAKALGFGNNFSQRMISGAVNAVNGFISWISTLPGRLAGELNKMLQMASNFAMQIANTLTGGAAGMVVGWITGSGEHSPGFMYDAFEGELQSMDDTANVYSNRLQSVIGSMGAGIVNKFGEPSLGLRYEDTMNHQLETNANGNTGNTGNTYNFYHYGDIDNEERMNRFVDAVIRRLTFENTTAGRTV